MLSENFGIAKGGINLGKVSVGNRKWEGNCEEVLIRMSIGRNLGWSSAGEDLGRREEKESIERGQKVVVRTSVGRHFGRAFVGIFFWKFSASIKLGSFSFLVCWK